MYGDLEYPMGDFHSTFDYKNNTWNIPWPERVSRHDVVYLSPPFDPVAGLPIGNGDVGAICWCEGSKIVLAVNKCDLWDDVPAESFCNWKADEEEHSSTLRHGCRLIVDFGMPVFDTFYLSDFDGRISLADASIHVTASGPLGSVSFRAFVNHADSVLCCSVEKHLCEDSPVSVSLERYGSRTFSHWYHIVNRDASIGLSGTEAGCRDSDIYITHRLSSGTFAVALGIDTAPTSAKRENSHSAEIVTDEECFSFFAAVSSPCDDPLQDALGVIDTAKRAGIQQIFEEHKKAWKAFWCRSLMQFGDDYLDNLWHLNMYYANSSQRGRYPGRFINGLWGWNRDFQPWNFYFHWNQQEVYWPLSAAGHHELLESYLNYRFDALPYGKKSAEALGADGAVVSDVCDRLGRNSSGELENHTPAAEIAMDFLRHYEYTGDTDFLTKMALPYILEAVRFLQTCFEKGCDGLYHAKCGTAYEGWVLLRDPVTEIACARVLFKTAAEILSSEPEASKWVEIAANLAPLPVVPVDDSSVDSETHLLRRGLFTGESVPCTRAFAAGYAVEDGRVLSSRIPDDSAEAGWGYYEGIFPAAEYSPVFPSGSVGLLQSGSADFETAVTSAKLYSPDCMGWDTLPIVLARLGLSDELRRVLLRWPDRWQPFANGFGNYDPGQIKRLDTYGTHMVRDAASSHLGGARLTDDEEGVERFPFPWYPFRHMGMEPTSVLACAMNEALLQSHDGAIRIAPAVTCTQTAQFTLHARGGFIVSAEVRNGRLMWTLVESVLGNVCRVCNPWESAYIFAGEELVCRSSDVVLEFPTNKGVSYLLTHEPDMLGRWVVDAALCTQNTGPKSSTCGAAHIGVPRRF